MTKHENAQPLSQDKFAEDLLWQAKRSIELGSALCTCEGHYHYIWSTLRAAGVVRGLKNELPLLESVLAPHLNNDTKFLIAGSADPGLFAAIGQISGLRSPAITVVDKCRAPLQLIREFADMKGVSCRILHKDILDLDGTEKWEKILLHYTVDFVEFAQRKRFLERLRVSLEPEGRLICIAKTNQRGVVTGEANLESAFLVNAKNAIGNSDLRPILQDNNFEKMLLAYGKAATERRLRMTAAQELKNLLLSTGFAIAEEHTAQRASTIRTNPDAGRGRNKGSVDVTALVAEHGDAHRM